MQLRRLLANIHLWAAIATFVVMIPLGLTGVVLAWPEQFNALSNPPPKASGAATLPLSAYFSAAEQALGPKAQLSTVTLPAREGLPVSVATAQRRGPPAPGAARTPPRVVWLDPGTAKVLKVGSPGSPLFGWAHEFHETLSVRGWGRTAVGVMGVVLGFLALSGIWLWWPRVGFLKGFAFKRTVSTSLNLHYTAGFWISIPLAIVAISGVPLSFPSLLGGGGEGPPRGEAPPAPRAEGFGPPSAGGFGPPAVSAPAGPRLTPDAAAKAAQASQADGKLVSVAKPAGRQPWRVQMMIGGERRTVQIDDATGEASLQPPPRPPGGIIRLIHEGSTWGPVWKWLVTLTGLAPLFFAVTGLWSWLKRQARKAKAA